MRTRDGALRALLLLLTRARLVRFNLPPLAAGGSAAPGDLFGAAFANVSTTAITLHV